jgi:N-carbamoyl-L-amino-acid hydrolase
MSSFDTMWADLEDLGRDPRTNGYRRFAWTGVDAELRDWFAGESARRGLDLTEDRMGNQWAWWGDPDAQPGTGVVTGSHLDSVPDGGAYDGPLGVISAFAALDALRAEGFAPRRPIGVVNFVDEEGARFGVACAGSRVLTGAMSPDRARALTDADGLTMAQAWQAAGRSPSDLGPDPAAVGRIRAFVELHVEQGRGLVDLGQPVAVGTAIWPHGRWRIDLPGIADHAGTTRLADRQDAMIGFAECVLAAREAAQTYDCVATIGKVHVQPGGVNAIPSAVTGWLDARGADAAAVAQVVADVGAVAAERGGVVREESWTDSTGFPETLTARISASLGGVPALSTGAGHDAGILAAAGVPAAMLFVRNPTGVSHSPHEFAERDDCLAGVAALTTVVRDLAGEPAR